MGCFCLGATLSPCQHYLAIRKCCKKEVIYSIIIFGLGETFKPLPPLFDIDLGAIDSPLPVNIFINKDAAMLPKRVPRKPPDC